MKAFILAAGRAPASARRLPSPKPMVEIGGKSILLHIMKMYSHHGQAPLMRLAEDDQLVAFKHDGFRQRMGLEDYALHEYDTEHIDFIVGKLEEFFGLNF